MSIKATRAIRSRNILLQKIVVGKGKVSTYDLPPEDHVYGQTVTRDPMDDFVIQGSQPKETKNVRKTKKSNLPSDKDPHYTYGKPTRSSTPVGRVMTTVKEQQKNHTKTKKANKEKLVAHALPKPRMVKQIEEKPLFKMSKFKKIGPVVSSHRQTRPVAIGAV